MAIVNQMTGVRSNFMAAFLAAFGRQAEVTRPELVAFEGTWTPEQVGPGGYVLRFPSWLTSDEYRVKNADGTFKRGVFAMPWAEYDAFVAAEATATAEAARVKAEKDAKREASKAETAARKAAEKVEADNARAEKARVKAEAKAKADAEKAAKAANATNAAVQTVTQAVNAVESAAPVAVA